MCQGEKCVQFVALLDMTKYITLYKCYKAYDNRYKALL